MLYSISIALIVATVLRGSLRAGASADTRASSGACAPRSKHASSTGSLSARPGERADALLELVLRYTSVVRGRDADRLTESLEEHGGQRV